jgi:flagellar protein FlaH
MVQTQTQEHEHRRRLISTGNAELDKKMGGGIPEDSLTLVEGQSEAGKSVLTQQLVWGALNTGKRVSYYTTENTVRSLCRQMSSLDMDITDFFLLGRINIYPIRSAPDEKEARKMLHATLRHMTTTRDRDFLAFDSISVFITNIPEQETLSFFTAAKDLCDDNKSVLLTMHSYAFSETMFVRIRSISDAYLRLRVTEMGTQLVKEMEVAKVRGAELGTGNVIAFDVEPNMGMRIIPMTKAKA